ncbi:MAG TPA: hypothetical protein VHR65_03705 [Solirubrobacterales bacterium]|nr:hypothetical protein [Solirubrobacterales bacterium]
MSKGQIAVAVGALMITLIAAGCGGNEEAAPAPITKAQFIKQADAACTKGNEHFQTLYEDYVKETKLDITKKRTAAQWAEIVEKVLAPPLEQEVAEVRALGVPKGDGGKIGAILGAIEEGLEKVEEDPSVAANTEEEFRKSYKLATEYGLRVCGR